jgi:hypothetical protein
MANGSDDFDRPNVEKDLGCRYLNEGTEKEAESKFAPYEKKRDLLKNEAYTNYRNAKDNFAKAIKKVKSGTAFKHLDSQVTPEVQLAWTYHDLAFILQKEKQYLASEENWS